MRRIMKTVFPCLLGGWVACAAYAQAPGSGRPSRPAKPAPPAAKDDPQVTPAQGQGIAPAGALAPRVADTAAAQEKMNQLLSLWSEQSQTIKTLDAKFVREDFSKVWGDKTVYVGRAILKSPDLAFLDFRKVVEGPKGKGTVPHEQIRCTGKEVYQYLSDRSQILVYPLAKQQRQRALEEGPLPFLFNMRADEAKKRYLMTLVNETITHYVISIQPREAIDRDAFIRADVLLEKARFLPEALRLYLPPDGKNTQTYNFKGEGLFIHPNAKVNERNFEFEPLAGWDVVRNPDAHAAAPQPAPDPRVATQRRPPLNKPVPGGYPQRR